MTYVLIVDDSAVDRRLAAGLITKLEMTAGYAEHGGRALEMMHQRLPDVVLTDLQMPEMDGLQLVREIRLRHPAVPVVLMTAHGSEEIAVQALQTGAASYVPKQNLVRDLAGTLRDVLAVTTAARQRQRALGCLLETHSHFVLGEEVQQLEPFIGYLQEQLRQMKTFNENELIQVGTALYEALVNAHEHGNLELDSALRESETNEYYELARERARQSPYADRRVYMTARIRRAEATFVVRDEGPGFDPGQLPDPTDPANLERVSGRGLFLIRTFMDQVEFNARGNEITMIKRQKS